MLPFDLWFQGLGCPSWQQEQKAEGSRENWKWGVAANSDALPPAWLLHPERDLLKQLPTVEQALKYTSL